MLSSYRVVCPDPGCGWTGSQVPSLLKDGRDAEITSGQRAWFRCPQCNRSWEVRIKGDQVETLPPGKQDG
jgi:hypothetical protein